MSKISKMALHNRIDRRVLSEQLGKEDFKRITFSFYRYVKITDPQVIRDSLFNDWFALNCFGRIYIAHEGINAQMSVPENNKEAFLKNLDSYSELHEMPIKWAIEDDGKSFIKLTIKIKHKIVADGLADDSFDVTNVGNHLSAIEFHELIEHPDAIVVDMRNHYESEIGHFKGALLPQSDTFREELDIVTEELKDLKSKKVLLYCTGGIRCEKASAYLKHQGFEDVNQLHGGIIEYVRQVNLHQLESKFIGKNFVFDNRLAERVSGEVISHCHLCGNPCDTHTNCANLACHILFIQCNTCSTTLSGCCSETCSEAFNDEQKQIEFRKNNTFTGKRWKRRIEGQSLRILKSTIV